MWFSSKVNRKELAEQLVITHQTAAVVVDSDRNLIASNPAFSEIGRKLNGLDRNGVLKSLIDHYDKANKTIAFDDFHLRQHIFSLTIKGLESCSLYLFEPLPEKLLGEQAWQQLLAFSENIYAVFDNHNNLVTSNIDSVDADEMYSVFDSPQLLKALQNAIKITDRKLRLSENDDFYYQVTHSTLDSDSGPLSAFLLSKQTQLADYKQFEMLSKVVSNTSTSVLITDKNGFVEYVNPGFEKLSGLTLAEVKGKKPGVLLQREQTDTDTIKRISQNLKHESRFMKRF